MIGALVALAGCARGGATPPDAQPPPVRTSPAEETRVTPMSNPFKLASAALDAYRARDLAAWRPLLVEPPAAGATPEVIFAHAGALKPGDAASELYFIDERHIAALIRRASGDSQALWLELTRAPAGGFLVVAFRATPEDPPTDNPVEG
ncbi:MAG: hypothetical protein CVU56_14030 [Deltaproteobacteria bacterium HGW-Deltaproteobacteria-14]|nr:MAG: hypothetical protein CVU56_14030 [Deltaproteobacteria bacterium HGW-Deltaproteobacteria-14]